MNDQPKPGFEDTEDIPELSEPNRRAFVGLFAVFALLLLYVIPYVYTSTPIACASCHGMKPYYDSWRASSHRLATPSCLDCHVRQDPLSLVAYRFMFYREIVAQVSGADLKPWGTTVPGVRSCHRSGCHSLNRLTSTSGELKINHRTHVTRAKLTCSSCHEGVAHQGIGRRSMLPSRQTCKRCHAKKMSDCGFCHVNPETAGRPPKETH
ncbi:MAG: hypothetical protein C4521_11005 [Actinobacteria bacterium]|nr:MAG: hypothetical protein C4521_11005 [Actinomycetota bacterium]